MSDTPLVDEVTARQFLERAAARTPTPGGGGIAALAGALASSMAEMALNFTVGAKKYALVEDKACELLAKVTSVRVRAIKMPAVASYVGVVVMLTKNAARAVNTVQATINHQYLIRAWIYLRRSKSLVISLLPL